MSNNGMLGMDILTKFVWLDVLKYMRSCSLWIGRVKLDVTCHPW